MSAELWIILYLVVGVCMGLLFLVQARKDGLVDTTDSNQELGFAIASGLVWPAVCVFSAVVVVAFWVKDKRAERTSE